MARYAAAIRGHTYEFADLASVLGKASPERSGDHLAGVAAESAEERVAAREVLADVPLTAPVPRGDGTPNLRARARPRR